MNLGKEPIAVNDEIFIEKNGKFQKSTVLKIHDNGKPVTAASESEVGLKLSTKIRKNSKLWKRGK